MKRREFVKLSGAVTASVFVIPPILQSCADNMNMDMNMDRRTALDIVHHTLAADYACQPSDWTSGAVIVVEAQEMPGRRRLPFRANEFVVTTLGRGAVICCSANRLEWVKANLAECSKDQLFSISIFAKVAEYVAQDGQVLKGPALRYLCAGETFRPAPVPAPLPLPPPTDIARVTSGSTARYGCHCVLRGRLRVRLPMLREHRARSRWRA